MAHRRFGVARLPLATLLFATLPAAALAQDDFFSKVPYDERLIDKLHRGDFDAIGTDERVVAGVFVLLIAYGLAECQHAVSDEDRLGLMPAFTKLQTQYSDIYLAVSLIAPMHPLTLETLGMRTTGGCENERFQTVGENLIHLVVSRTKAGQWGSSRSSARAPVEANAQRSQPSPTVTGSDGKPRRAPRRTTAADGWPARWFARCESEAPAEDGANRAEYLYWCRCTSDALARALPTLGDEERNALEADYSLQVVELEMRREDLIEPLGRCRRR